MVPSGLARSEVRKDGDEWVADATLKGLLERKSK
jgi:hypothetical protein